MKKQRKRIYTALLCACFLFSTASVPVSAAETEQEEMTTGNDYPIKYKGSHYRGKRTGYD